MYAKSCRLCQQINKTRIWQYTRVMSETAKYYALSQSITEFQKNCGHVDIEEQQLDIYVRLQEKNMLDI